MKFELEHLFPSEEQLTDRDLLMIEAGFQQARSTKPQLLNGIDGRAFHCPVCHQFGVNTLMGSVRYICGAETVGLDIAQECGKPRGDL